MTSPSEPQVRLDAVPRRLRPLAEAVLAHRLGALLLRVTGELIRVQIFDRAMTLAAQAFTSIFPILIMLSALSGVAVRKWVNDRLNLPAQSERLLQEALGGSNSNAFGIVGALIVVVSATGLARALTRAYRVIWMVPARKAGPAATGLQVLSVLILALFVVAIRLLADLTDKFPEPRLAGAAVTLVADLAVAVALPLMLLGPLVVARWRLLVAGAIFGGMMIAVRAAGDVYLPRAMVSSSEKYGTIGLAFTYIGWLYVLSFALLLAAIVGSVVTAPRTPPASPGPADPDPTDPRT
ncbi:YhjD/YihY/BrkB family envelope integrity protein [Actinoplanes sp. TBRC 11911]|uniref:YhjD/YihY/BrkB family envelope integrity protein n=1 Tax=Actinoplanes sp. TBRC 11911 TaxID=2729386 RepID=UPI00289CD091|nr:YhjD/YihY/BrkB family envelope integrity protein [Actinoplanes sp. TBRC 11911]